MTRTSEQKQADEALTAAIEQVMAAYNEIVKGVLSSYIVIAQRKFWNDDGDPLTQTYYIPCEDGASVSASDGLGMVEYIGVRLRKQIWVEDDEGD